MKTECLHFFHKHCLGRYITNMQQTYDEQKSEAQRSNNTIKDFQVRVTTKIFEDFGGALCKEFIVGREPVSTIHYIRPGTCINHPLH